MEMTNSYERYAPVFLSIANKVAILHGEVSFQNALKTLLEETPPQLPPMSRENCYRQLVNVGHIPNLRLAANVVQAYKNR